MECVHLRREIKGKLIDGAEIPRNDRVAHRQQPADDAGRDSARDVGAGARQPKKARWWTRRRVERVSVRADDERVTLSDADVNETVGAFDDIHAGELGEPGERDTTLIAERLDV